MQLEAGALFDRYRIEAVLGEGGMGRAYRAYDERLQRRVALKVLHVGPGTGHAGEAQTTNGAARLLREARLAAALDHPNAVAIFDVGEGKVEGEPTPFPYIAMELIVGRSLREYVGVAELPLAERIRWLTDAARALAAAHRRGLIHRDVKPENVMIRDDGVVKVLDFGIARRNATGSIDPAGETQAVGSGGTLTADGIVVGTPLYMSPEQMRGETLDGRADQFSWAVMAYELLSGRLPWDRGDGIKVVAQILSRDPSPVTSSTTPLPPGVQAAVMRALSKSPDARFASMDELIAAIDELGIRSSPSALPPPIVQPLGFAPTIQSTKSSVASEREPSIAPRARRSPLPLAGLALLAAIGAGAYLLHARSPGPVPAPIGGAPSSATALVDLAPPKTNPEALRTYLDALELLRRGDRAAGHVLEHAINLDPNLAPALMRLGYGMLYHHPSVARGYFRRAVELRATLSERDQGLLDAYAPSVENDPPDVAETRARLAKLLARYPMDAELADALGEIDWESLHCELAIPEFDRALALDPHYADAALGKAGCYAVQGNREGAIAASSECERAAPGSLDCLDPKFAAENKDGRCVDMLAEARRAILAHPDGVDSYFRAAQALYAVGSPLSAVVESIAQGRSRTLENATSVKARLLLDVNLAILQGDFAEAEKMEVSREAEKAVAGSSDEGTHSVGDWARAEIALETASLAAAADIAAEHRARSQAWTAELTPAEEPEFEYRSRFLGLLAHANRISKEEYAEARAARLAPFDKADPLVRGYLWLELYARTAVTADDAKEALEALPRFSPIPPAWTYPAGYPIGRVYQLAGQVDDAIPYLRQAASECDAIYFPFENTRASFALGQALESKGDVASACASYGVVIRRWGKAKPRSVTATAAKARMAALHCGQ